MKHIITLISIFLLAACASKSNNQSLEPIIKKEFIYIKCKVDKDILSTNKIVLKEGQEVNEIIKELIQELNSRKDKLDSIKNIDCIEIK